LVLLGEVKYQGHSLTGSLGLCLHGMHLNHVLPSLSVVDSCYKGCIISRDALFLAYSVM